MIRVSLVASIVSGIFVSLIYSVPIEASCSKVILEAILFEDVMARKSPSVLLDEVPSAMPVAEERLPGVLLKVQHPEILSSRDLKTLTTALFAEFARQERTGELENPSYLTLNLMNPKDRVSSLEAIDGVLFLEKFLPGTYERSLALIRKILDLSLSEINSSRRASDVRIVSAELRFYGKETRVVENVSWDSAYALVGVLQGSDLIVPGKPSPTMIIGPNVIRATPISDPGRFILLVRFGVSS